MDDPSETDNPLFEITLRSYHEPEIPGRTVIWGIPASNERVTSRFTVRYQDISNGGGNLLTGHSEI